MTISMSVFRQVRAGLQTAHQISEATGLTLGQVHWALTYLRQQDRIVKMGTVRSGGRPCPRYRVKMYCSDRGEG